MYRLQREGIAAALIRRLEAALAERGCLKVNLQVPASNAGVIAFYEKLGYSVEELFSMGKRLYQDRPNEAFYFTGTSFVNA